VDRDRWSDFLAVLRASAVKFWFSDHQITRDHPILFLLIRAIGVYPW
jgi:hypothetical protein